MAPRNIRYMALRKRTYTPILGTTSMRFMSTDCLNQYVILASGADLARRNLSEGILFCLGHETNVSWVLENCDISHLHKLHIKDVIGRIKAHFGINIPPKPLRRLANDRRNHSTRAPESCSQ